MPEVGAAALLIALTLVANVRFLGTGFAASDSLPLIETSRFTSLSDAARLFTQPVMAGTRFVLGEAVYRPFVSVTFGIDYAFWGLNAVGYHVTNLLLHLVGVGSLLFLLTRLGLGYWSSLAGASLFALHPLVVATIPVIARRDSLIPVTAFVASAGCLLAADQGRGMRRALLLLGSLVFMGVALLSKESAFLALLMLPLLFLSGNTGRSDGLRHAVSSARMLVPFVILGAVVFSIRLMVLRGFGGGSGSDLLYLDLDRYSQTIGAFTRDLAWPLAWLASSTREIWPRLALAVLVGLGLTLAWLPRKQAILASAGTVWVVGFVLFGVALKISTIAWLAYFALVGVALLFAAGMEGALLRIRSPVTSRGWRALAERTPSSVLLIGLTVYGLTALWASPLRHDYYQWQVAGDVTQRFTQALTACLAEAPQASRANLVALPSSFDDGRVETNLLGVTLLEDYAVEAALRLALPDRHVTVHASSYETLRLGADTLRFSCAQLPPDGVELTTSY